MVLLIFEKNIFLKPVTRTSERALVEDILECCEGGQHPFLDSVNYFWLFFVAEQKVDVKTPQIPLLGYTRVEALSYTSVL